MKKYQIILALLLATLFTMSSCNKANSNNNALGEDPAEDLQSVSSSNENNNLADVSNWNKSSQMAVDEITKKYGKPNGITSDELIWTDAGVWKKIAITKMESKHSFPIEHTDMMQTTIMYKVPEDKMDELGMFDGSVTFDRTQGTMSARCDKEANNFLALNLANDIITDKKTVEQARKAYGDIIKEKMTGANPEYMSKLTFSSQPKAADPDKNTTGLTKVAVTAAIEKNNSSK
ncbi:MAG: hypothetical protein H7239_02935 [Flavobacterium sp.]|nr:hypothetical protein [Flavobacterium sp.]